MKLLERQYYILLWLLGMPYEKLEVDKPEWTQPHYYHQN